MPSTTTGAQPAEWVLCGNCRTIVYGVRWIRSMSVCPECGAHSPVDAKARLDQLADPGSVRYLEPPSGIIPDILGFVDTMPYPERVAEARARTGLHAAVLCARIEIEGNPVVVAIMDFGFLGGSMGALAGEAVNLAAEFAIAERLPLLAVTASGGARMQEGAISLMQMAKTSAAWAKMDEAGLLTITLITDPTFGGVAASFATLSDVLVAETGARLGFAGRRVIEQTIRQKLPPEFQTVEFLYERGFIDMVLTRPSLRGELARLLRKCPTAASRNSPQGLSEPVPAGGPGPVISDPSLLSASEPWQQVRRARDLSRPTTLDYIRLAFDDFCELHGDRVSGDCAAMVVGLGKLAGTPVAVIGHQKGHTPTELTERNFGMAIPAGYRKAARVMRLAAKLGLPVITLVDTPGAYPGAQAEEQGQAAAIAESLRLMTSLPVPVVTVVTGEGGSGGALGIAVANRVLMWEHAIYSVISPEGCASILWRDPALGPRAAQALGLNSRELLRLGIVDGVLPEPEAGIGADPVAAAAALRSALRASLTELAELDATQLIQSRRDRFARYGRSEPAARPGALAAIAGSARGARA